MRDVIGSTPGLRHDLLKKPLNKVKKQQLKFHIFFLIMHVWDI